MKSANPTPLAFNGASKSTFLTSRLSGVPCVAAAMKQKKMACLKRNTPRFTACPSRSFPVRARNQTPNPATQLLFDEARRLSIGFYLGYAELAVEGGVKHRFNTSVLVGPDAKVLDLVVRITGSGYQRLLGPVFGRLI